MPSECNVLINHDMENNITSWIETIAREDAGWIIRNAFLVFTMQNGFGLLEAGCVSAKNMANIMVKNILDVCFGGLSYWLIGYELSFGAPLFSFMTTTPTVTTASSLLVTAAVNGTQAAPHHESGSYYTSFFFQLSYATTATTIVSGAVAERMRLSAYIVYSTVNMLAYCVCVRWVWSADGMLAAFGAYDFAGACVVHFSGGMSALAAVYVIGARIGRFGEGKTAGGSRNRVTSPVTVLTGTFILWWAWLGFNCGSTYGLSGDGWKVAALVGVNTMQGSVGGCIAGVLVSFALHRRQHYDISYLSVSVLAGLVGVTGACSVMTPVESFVCGAIASMVAILSTTLLERFKLDDPVGAIPVHLSGAIVGTLAVGVFGRDVFGVDALHGRRGLWHGGSTELLCAQLVALACCGAWSAATTAVAFLLLKHTIGLRLSVEEEILGADFIDHGIPVYDGEIVKKLERVMRSNRLQPAEATLKIKELRELLRSANSGEQSSAELLEWLREHLVAVTHKSMLGSVNYHKNSVAAAPFGEATAHAASPVAETQPNSTRTTTTEGDKVDDDETKGSDDESLDRSYYNAPGVPVFLSEQAN